jgi:hypothetical protein
LSYGLGLCTLFVLSSITFLGRKEKDKGEEEGQKRNESGQEQKKDGM